MTSTRLPIDDLVVYCAAQVLAAGEECTFERLVYECFTRFPETFGLRRYPHWPDSARVNKSWLRCRTDKGWLVGSVQEGFRLTPAGETAAKLVAARLQSPVSALPLAEAPRGRERYESLLRSIRADPLFTQFLREREINPTNMEIRRLLGATLETPKRVLKQNLHSYRQAAQAYLDQEVLDFLSACEKITAS